jgi:hypothetical protein
MVIDNMLRTKFIVPVCCAGHYFFHPYPGCSDKEIPRLNPRRHLFWQLFYMGIAYETLNNVSFEFLNEMRESLYTPRK